MSILAGLDPAGKTYYWAIDEVNEAGPDPCFWPGDIWSFTTPLCQDVNCAIDAGLVWLRSVQNDNGSWAWEDGKGTSCVAMTGLAVLAFLNNANIDVTDPSVSAGLEYILSRQQPVGEPDEGAFESAEVVGGRETAKVYETGLALPALVAAWQRTSPPDRDPRWQPAIANAANYLLNTQCIETEGRTYDPLDPYNYTPSDSLYGGWGYPRYNWADLSNTQFALWGLKVAENALGDDFTFPANRKAAAADYFIANCQNPDGGFVYGPPGYWWYDSWAGGNSYGSMTAAGLWSLWCTDVIEGDPRVDAGKNWFIDNLAYHTNPHLDNTWFYYYVMSTAKAFVIHGWDLLDGIDWYHDPGAFADVLLSTQLLNGSWPRWGEEPKVMTTAEAILALETKQTVFTGIWRKILSSPGDLHVYDPYGNHVGINYETGEVECEIPSAEYSGPGTEPQVITIPDPMAGTYTTKVAATGSGWYTLDSVMQTDAGTIIFSDMVRKWADEGQIDEWTTSLAPIAGPTIETTAPPIPEMLTATIDINPDTLNLKSKAKWITCYIEPPEGYSAEDIDAATVALIDMDGLPISPSVYAEEHPTEIGDYDGDGISALMTKFDRQALKEYLTEKEKEGETELSAIGMLTGGSIFYGSDEIWVIKKGDEKK